MPVDPGDFDDLREVLDHVFVVTLPHILILDVLQNMEVGFIGSDAPIPGDCRSELGELSEVRLHT